MGRIIKPSEIQEQTDSVIRALGADADMLLEALHEIQAFSHTQGLQGTAWSGIKAQMSAHNTVIRGLTCMIDSMTETSAQLTSLCGAEELDEELLIEQLNQLTDMKCSFENAIDTYNSYLRNEIYEFCMGWYARSMIAHYETAIEIAEEEIRIIQEKLAAIDEIDHATSDLTTSVKQLCSSVTQGMSHLKSSWNGSGFLIPSLQNMDWMSVINREWEKNVKRKEEERLRCIQAYHDELPQELKPYISLDDLKATDDGFVMCTKSMQDIMKEMGLPDDYEIGDGVKVDLYDDWFLTGVRDDKGTLTYTLIKMREPGDAQGASGSAVPFIALDMDACSKSFGKVIRGKQLTDEDKAELYKAFSDVTNGEGKENVVLRDYFANPASDGSYVIADCIVDKNTHDGGINKNGVLEISYDYDVFDEYAKEHLEALQKKGIYDKEKHTIQVRDVNHLSQDEYNAILTVTTGNIDAYSFAGENVFHASWQQTADAYQSTLEQPYAYDFGIPVIIGNVIEGHTIISDAGVGESKMGFIYEKVFKSPDGKLYKEQKRLHS